jgi:hypothetical protein
MPRNHWRVACWNVGPVTGGVSAGTGLSGSQPNEEMQHRPVAGDSVAFELRRQSPKHGVESSFRVPRDLATGLINYSLQ